MQSAAIREIAETVLQRELGSRGLDRVMVREDVDHDGEPALFIEAVLKPDAARVGGEVSSRIHGALNEALLGGGEQRFPYFVVRYPSDEQPEDVPVPSEH